MILKEVKVITINWIKVPFNFAEIEKLKTETDYGLYQVYGEHYAYGKESLLYIGKAYDQNFATRILGGGRLYYDFLETTAVPKYILVGYISKSSKVEDNEKFIDDWRASVDIAEQILIGTHSPAFNKQITKNLATFNAWEENFLLINWGEKGSLLPEVSTLRNSYQFYDFEEPLK